MYTETVTYKDGTSATGPAPLPRTSPNGSPAIGVASDLDAPVGFTSTPASHNPTTFGPGPQVVAVVEVFTPAVGDSVTLEFTSGKQVVDYHAVVVAGTVNDLSVAYLDPSKYALLGTVDWRNAWVRVDQVKHIDHPDVVAGKEGRLWYHLSPEAAADKVAAANKTAADKAIAEAQKKADAEFAVLQADADKRATEQLAAEKAAEAQKSADEIAAAKVKAADEEARARAEKQAASPGVVVPSEAQKAAEAAAAKRRDDEAKTAADKAGQAEAENARRQADANQSPADNVAVGFKQ